jgi:hypothetical protein
MSEKKTRGTGTSAEVEVFTEAGERIERTAAEVEARAAVAISGLLAGAGGTVAGAVARRGGGET